MPFDPLDKASIAWGQLAPIVEERRRDCLQLMAQQLNAATAGPKNAAKQALAALDALEKYWGKEKQPAPPKPEEAAPGAQGEQPAGQVDEAAQGEEDTTEAPKISESGGDGTIDKDISLYDRTFKRLTRALFAGRLTEFEFVDNLFTSMRQNFNDAWQEGRDAVKAGAMTDEDRLRVQDITAEQAQYAPGFAEFVVKVAADGGKFSDLLPRAAMWVGKYDEVRAEAMTAARAEQRLEWVWDPRKEHCSSCRDLNGRVYTAATWAKQNIRPRSTLLECGGYRCGCKFVPTNKPVTKGPFPVWIGNPRRKSLEVTHATQNDQPGV